METKICTSIEQSKKLIESGIDVNTADMGWNIFVDDTIRLLPIDDWDLIKDGSGNVAFIPAWSLTALVELLPYEIEENGAKYRLLITHNLVQYPRLTTLWPSLYTSEADSTFDAVFGVVVRLLENRHKEKESYDKR